VKDKVKDKVREKANLMHRCQFSSFTIAVGAERRIQLCLPSHARADFRASRRRRLGKAQTMLLTLLLKIAVAVGFGLVILALL
jgi:hypothetical protein